MLFLAMVMMNSLTSCGGDNNEPDDSGSHVAGASYYIMLNPVNTSGDQTDFVNTTVIITDKTTNKELLKKDVVLDKSGLVPVEIKSESLIKNFPFAVEISQTLKSGIDITQKSTYKLGLQIQIAVSSCDADNKVIKTLVKNERISNEISSENLSKNFPHTVSYVFSIDKKGDITTE